VGACAAGALGKDRCPRLRNAVRANGSGQIPDAQQISTTMQCVVLDSLGRADLTQGWTDRGPRRDLSTLCLRRSVVLAPPFPRGGAAHRTKTPPLIATFVCCAAPGSTGAAGSRAIPPGIERPPDEGPPPRLTVPPCFPRRLPPSRLTGPLSTAWVSSYTRSSSAITGSYRIVSASKPAIFFAHCRLRRLAQAYAASGASWSALALVVAGGYGGPMSPGSGGKWLEECQRVAVLSNM
jgi:hypothetical protein